jgi:hypothetical protein
LKNYPGLKNYPALKNYAILDLGALGAGYVRKINV